MSSETIKVLLEFKENLSKGLDTATSKLDDFTQKVDAINQAFLPLSAAAGLAIGASIKFGSEWSKASGNAARGLDLSGKELEKFTSNAEKLTEKLSFQKTSAEIVNLATDIGKLGVASNDVLAYTESVVKLATATDQLDKTEALSENIAKVGNVFQFASKDVEVFGGALNKLADATAATPDNILDVVQRLSGIAKQSKLSASETAAWGATLISAGKDASTTATFMNTFLGTLGAGSNLSKDAQKALKALGFSAKELGVAFDKDANGTMIKFLESVNKLDSVSQREILGKIFGKEFSDDAALLATQTQNLKNNLKAAGDEAGNIAKVNAEFKAMAENSLEGQMKTLQNQLFEIGKIIGLAILPAIIGITKGVTPIITAVMGFLKQYPVVAQIGVVLLGLLGSIAVIANIATTVIGLTTVIPAIVTAVTTAVSGLTAILTGGLTAGVVGFTTTAIPALLSGLVAIGAGLWGALAPILPIIAVIALIAGAAYLIYKNWEPIKKFFADAWEGIKQGAADTVKSINDTWEGLKQGAIDLVKGIGDAWNGLVDMVNGIGKALFDGFTYWLVQMIGESTVDTLYSIFERDIPQIINGVKILIDRGIQGTIEWVKEKLNFVTGVLNEWGNNINKFFSEKFNEASEIVSGVWDKITGVINSKTSEATAVVNTNVNQIKTEFNNLTAPIIESVSNTVNGATNELTKFKDMATNALELTRQAVIWKFGEMVNGAIGELNKLRDMASGAIESVRVAVMAKFQEMVSGAVNWGRDLVNGFAKGVREKIGKAVDSVGEATTAMAQYLPHSPAKRGALSDLDKRGMYFTQTFVGGIKKSGLTGFLNGVVKTPTKATGGITPTPRNQSKTSSGIVINYSPRIGTDSKDPQAVLRILRNHDKELIDIIDKALRRLNRKVYT